MSRIPKADTPVIIATPETQNEAPGKSRRGAMNVSSVDVKNRYTSSLSQSSTADKSIYERDTQLAEPPSGSESKNRKNSDADSGIFSLADDNEFPSIQNITLSQKQARNISKGLETIYNDLSYAGRCIVENLPDARKAFTGTAVEALAESLDQAGLASQGQAVLKSALLLLDWCENSPPPKYPESLKNAGKHYKKLQNKSTQALEKLNHSNSSGNRNKASRALKALDQHREQTYKPLQSAFDKVVHKELQENPVFSDLKAGVKAIRDCLPDDCQVNAPIDDTVKTWVYNIKLQRAKSLARVKE